MSAGERPVSGDESPVRPLAVLIACALIMFWIGPLYAWSLFVEPLENMLRESRASISGVFSIANVGFTVGLLVGPFCYGRISLSHLSLLTIALGASGLLLAAGFMSLWSVWIGYGGLFGLANGLGYALCLQIVHNTLPGRAGLGTGVIVSSYALGSIAWSPLLSWSIVQYGPAGTLMGSAAAAIVIGGVAHAVLMRSGATLRIEVSKTDESPGSPSLIPIIVLWFGFLFGSITGMLTIGHASPIVSAQGGGAAATALAVVLVTIGNFIGRFAGGWTSDRMAPHRTTAALQVFAAGSIAVALVWPAPNSSLFMLFSVGLGYGWMSGSYPVIIAQTFGSAAVGKIYGYVNTAWGIAALTAPYAAGMIFDISANYDAALTIAGVTAFCASLVLLGMQRQRR